MGKKKLSQTELVLKILLKKGSISNVYATYTLGMMRLSERIRENRKLGHKIERFHEVDKKTGKKSRAASYRLIKG